MRNVDRPRVVGDDLVAEALGLERVRVVAEQLAHPGVDRREEVRVVVGRDLLEDAGEALEAHARCRRSVNGSGTRPSGRWSNSMNTRFQISSQRGQCLAVVRDALAGPRRGARRGRSGSRCTARTARCRPSARSSCRRRRRRRPSAPSAPAAGRSRRARRPRRRRRPCRSSRPGDRPGCPGRWVRKSHAQWIASRLK